jgi:hypothetical protein
MNPMKMDAPMDTLDPAKTALGVVHMVKGVAGEVDTPFNRIFRIAAKNCPRERRILEFQSKAGFNVRAK